jgi:hypothetical protein
MRSPQGVGRRSAACRYGRTLLHRSVSCRLNQPGQVPPTDVVHRPRLVRGGRQAEIVLEGEYSCAFPPRGLHLHTSDFSARRRAQVYQSARRDRPLLASGQDESYFQPHVSAQHGTPFEHGACVLDRSLAVERHDLLLIGTGDWNDGMNQAVRAGRERASGSAGYGGQYTRCDGESESRCLPSWPTGWYGGGSDCSNALTRPAGTAEWRLGPPPR